MTYYRSLGPYLRRQPRGLNLNAVRRNWRQCQTSTRQGLRFTEEKLNKCLENLEASQLFRNIFSVS